MRELAGAVMEPQTVIGSGRHVAATPRMELGALTTPIAWPCASSYAIQKYVVDPASGASMPCFVVPIVLSDQHVTAGYLHRFLFDPARATRASADTLAESLEEATAHLSVIRRAERYPAFWDLQELGLPAVALALERLTGTHRPLWLFFLQRATGERVAREASSVDDAARRWRVWGEERGLV